MDFLHLLRHTRVSPFHEDTRLTDLPRIKLSSDKYVRRANNFFPPFFQTRDYRNCFRRSSKLKLDPLQGLNSHPISQAIRIIRVTWTIKGV